MDLASEAVGIDNAAQFYVPCLGFREHATSELDKLPKLNTSNKVVREELKKPKHTSCGIGCFRVSLTHSKMPAW